jgi:hypothetical protein
MRDLMIHIHRVKYNGKIELVEVNPGIVGKDRIEPDFYNIYSWIRRFLLRLH